MNRYGLFVPEKFVADTVRCLKFLEGLSLKEQLARRKINSFKFLELTSAKARLVWRPGCFEVFLDSRRKKFWPVDLGHEIGHTFFFDLSHCTTEAPERLAPRFSHVIEWEERFCNCFSFQWVITGSNTEETERLFSKFDFGGVCRKFGDHSQLKLPLD